MPLGKYLLFLAAVWAGVTVGSLVMFVPAVWSFSLMIEALGPWVPRTVNACLIFGVLTTIVVALAYPPWGSGGD